MLPAITILRRIAPLVQWVAGFRSAAWGLVFGRAFPVRQLGSRYGHHVTRQVRFDASLPTGMERRFATEAQRHPEQRGEGVVFRFVYVIGRCAWR